jgi:hypothetical protein
MVLESEIVFADFGKVRNTRDIDAEFTVSFNG